MTMTIELSDHDIEYLRRGNEIFKTSISGLIVVVKYRGTDKRVDG